MFGDSMMRQQKFLAYQIFPLNTFWQNLEVYLF